LAAAKGHHNPAGIKARVGLAALFFVYGLTLM
jgi:hypothetical protein